MHVYWQLWRSVWPCKHGGNERMAPLLANFITLYWTITMMPITGNKVASLLANFIALYWLITEMAITGDNVGHRYQWGDNGNVIRD